MTGCSRKIGKLALEWCGCAFELQVLKSSAGYYLGTVDEMGAPCLRESECYWQTPEDAKAALESGDWPQKLMP